ncbi:MULTISPECIES: hypothetical protein [Micromonospora]|jgi:hypothetical protein|uniref:Uncharacterized protein n=1 Tax=Micromonospora sicca TaxID=2202420 RepID=A0ABU5JMW3_9ACTN|nr:MULTISPECIES: hypothetical protein [unclassified Micromonospora]MBM0226403.1 hypothetical protein [Micromonospora sp. ATA51]MDZ5447141.1 hypothetical protein [Micromonospora sp. 4G57]MDZ5493743.1 hypothetical protein [Micromonospora sp. 4G53]
MTASVAHLHGGPLDGVDRPIAGSPDELVEFTHETPDGTWYVEYRRARRADDGWHYEATGGMDKQDEE